LHQGRHAREELFERQGLAFGLFLPAEGKDVVAYRRPLARESESQNTPSEAMSPPRGP
jgi:hypothetical protein